MEHSCGRSGQPRRLEPSSQLQNDRRVISWSELGSTGACPVLRAARMRIPGDFKAREASGGAVTSGGTTNGVSGGLHLDRKRSCRANEP